MAFVIDTSGSMNPSRTQVKANAKLFLTKFNPGPVTPGRNGDRMALIHFSYGAEVDDRSGTVKTRGFDRTSMNTHIDALRILTA